MKPRVPFLVLALSAAIALAGVGVWRLLQRAPACPVLTSSPTAQDYLNAGRALRPSSADERDDRSAALSCFLEACDRNLPEGCRMLTETFEDKATQPGALTQRLTTKLIQGCDSADVGSCHALAVLYRDGKGQPPAPALAVATFHRLCEMKSISLTAAPIRRAACLDVLHLTSDQPNEADTFRRLAVACLKSSAECRTLAVAFQNGSGVPRDPLLARKFYDWSCRLDQPGWDPDHLDLRRPPPKPLQREKAGSQPQAAPTQPGGLPCFDLDDLDEQMTTQATDVATKCEAGDPSACLDAATFVIAEADDPIRALKELQKGCDGGVIAACAHLGEAQRENGDFAAAFQTFTQACARNSGFACEWLAYMQLYGETIPSDRAAARTSYDKSCALGMPHACVEADTLSNG